MENYFAAANTSRGFVGWFDDIFDPRRLDRIYIIKGGSGTGKSTLMKKVASIATEHGAECEYYYCSSDPLSLDGIIAHLADGRSVAMLDGTAPHTHDPKFPGAADEIVNLGEYWCDDILRAQKKEIISLADAKSRLFSSAFASFATAGELMRSELGAAREFLLADKLRAMVERLITRHMHEHRIKRGAGVKQIRVLSAFSTLGEHHFDSFEHCDNVYLVGDAFGTSSFLFDSLLEMADKYNLSYDRAPSVLIPELTEAVRFPELSLSIVSRTSKKDTGIINMVRFIDRDVLRASDKAHRKALKKTRTELIGAGLSKLARVRELHESLERIYIGAMDFTRLEEAGARLISKMGI